MTETPLFPLQTVLFPGGLLELKIFEARYVDLIGRCLRERSAFGVVTLQQGHEVKHPGEGPVRFASIGTLAELIEVDSERPGILQVRCRGAARFRLTGPAEQRADGLWFAPTESLADDRQVAPDVAQAASIDGLRDAISALQERGMTPFLAPHRLDDAGWIANRWCELLPIPSAAKLQLLVLADPLERLQRIDALLRGQPLIDEAQSGDADLRPPARTPDDDADAGDGSAPPRSGPLH